jgi:uncharacterized protein YcaQ
MARTAVEVVLTKQRARQVAVCAQLLDARPRPTLIGMIDHLGFVQLDPTAALAPSADLVAWSRLGTGYRPEQLRAALEGDRLLFEYNAMVYPMTDLALYRPAMRDWPPDESPWSQRARAWVEANGPFRRYVLTQLEGSGPVRSRDLQDRSVTAWSSGGWTNHRSVTQMLEFLTARGEVAVSARVGNQRLWDLADRVYPVDVPVLDAVEARRRRDAKRLQALGVARPSVVGEAGVLARIDGVPGLWRVQPDLLDTVFEGRTALLSPFDRLVHDRARAQELFDFEYRLEMYVPKDKRRWGYYALPVLQDDRLVAKVDAKADRATATLRLNAIHLEAHVPDTARDAILRELDALASWLDLEHVHVR